MPSISVSAWQNLHIFQLSTCGRTEDSVANVSVHTHDVFTSLKYSGNISCLPTTDMPYTHAPDLHISPTVVAVPAALDHHHVQHHVQNLATRMVSCNEVGISRGVFSLPWAAFFRGGGDTLYRSPSKERMR